MTRLRHLKVRNLRPVTYRRIQDYLGYAFEHELTQAILLSLEFVSAYVLILDKEQLFYQNYQPVEPLLPYLIDYNEPLIHVHFLQLRGVME